MQTELWTIFNTGNIKCIYYTKKPLDKYKRYQVQD